MSLCEKCHQNEATVSFVEVKNKEKKAINLCAECAQNASYIEKPSFSYSLNDFLTNFLEVIAMKSKEEEQKLQCDVCHITYAEFQKKTRFGCANDYIAFQKFVIPLLQHIHGTNQHKGKMPSRWKKQEKINELKQALKEAVEKEQYEDAIVIRDQLRMLEVQHPQERKGKEDGF